MVPLIALEASTDEDEARCAVAAALRRDGFCRGATTVNNVISGRRRKHTHGRFLLLSAMGKNPPCPGQTVSEAEHRRLKVVWWSEAGLGKTCRWSVFCREAVTTAIRPVLQVDCAGSSYYYLMANHNPLAHELIVVRFNPQTAHGAYRWK